MRPGELSLTCLSSLLDRDGIGRLARLFWRSSFCRSVPLVRESAVLLAPLHLFHSFPVDNVISFSRVVFCMATLSLSLPYLGAFFPPLAFANSRKVLFLAFPCY